MKYAIDLHIHSLLSPCADNNMTPNNIVNMSKIKGLDIISVTDHNCALNLPAINTLCKSVGILLLPGMEVNTKEEIHLLCYFESVDIALEFGKFIYKYLPNIKNDKKIFGEQLVLDENDNIIDEVPKLLISALDISVEKIVDTVKGLKGKVVPAHIDRKSYSLLYNLGFIPCHLDFKTLEISNKKNINLISSQIKENNYKIITSSDAHFLEQILERKQFLELTQRKIMKTLSNL